MYVTLKALLGWFLGALKINVHVSLFSHPNSAALEHAKDKALEQTSCEARRTFISLDIQLAVLRIHATVRLLSRVAIFSGLWCTRPEVRRVNLGTIAVFPW